MLILNVKLEFNAFTLADSSNSSANTNFNFAITSAIVTMHNNFIVGRMRPSKLTPAVEFQGTKRARCEQDVLQKGTCDDDRPHSNKIPEF